MSTADLIYRFYADLSRDLAPIREEVLRSVPTVAAVYDPLQYATRPWKRYLEMFCTGRREVLFLGMNPGPWGMAQTGIPFGEISAVRDWMGIEEPVDQPAEPHPARPVEGFGCARSEVSGRRLWALMRERFGTADAFFRNHLVLNFCPLAFLGERGQNITPDKLPKRYRALLDDACERTLARAIDSLAPRHLVGIGAFARARLDRVSSSCNSPRNVVQMLHPSPASPAANRGWASAAVTQLEAAGVWQQLPG